MSYNFKKIIDLELVNEVPEGANVLIETDGATKRLPSTAIKPAPIQSDLSQNDPSAPDYVKNRTHYETEETVNEPLNITWDGNTEGLVSVDMVDGYGMIACKVSDAILTKEQIEKGFSFVAKNFEDHPYSEQDMTINSIENSLVFAFQKDMIGFLFVHNDNAEFEDYVFPEKGLYFTVSYAYEEPAYILSFTTTEPVEHTKTVVHKLDKKYLPDDVGGGGVETVYLFRTPEDTARIIEEIIYDEKGRMQQLSYRNTLEISKQFADDLYQKWVEGKTRVIIVTMTGLVDGGADSVGTLISLNKAALDETGKSWEMYAQTIYGREIKSIRIC